MWFGLIKNKTKQNFPAKGKPEGLWLCGECAGWCEKGCSGDLIPTADGCGTVSSTIAITALDLQILGAVQCRSQGPSFWLTAKATSEISAGPSAPGRLLEHARDGSHYTSFYYHI